MKEPVWLTTELVIAIHEEQLSRFGGPVGLRDAGALDSAHYENGALASLAAAYAFGIAKNHPFVDGNKRTAWLALIAYLGLNDIDFIVPEPDAVVVMLALAAGEIEEEGLARWIADRMPAA